MKGTYYRRLRSLERGSCTTRRRGGHGIPGNLAATSAAHARSRRLARQPCGAIVIGSSLARAVEAEVTSKSCGELWSCSCANECLIIFVLSTPWSAVGNLGMSSSSLVVLSCPLALVARCRRLGCPLRTTSGGGGGSINLGGSTISLSSLIALRRHCLDCTPSCSSS